MSIPLLRLDGDKAATAAKLRETCIDVGFFYLQGHGIDEDLQARVFEQSKKLFALSEASKRAMSDPVMSRGYTAMEEETLDPEVQKCGDTKEGFYIGNDIPIDDPLYYPAKLRGPNQWPSQSKTPDMEDPDAFAKVMKEYHAAMSKLALQVVRWLALALELDENYFDKDFVNPIASLRLLHYAATESKPEEGVYACGAHSDYGMITLLLTDDNPGLQILTKDNEWIDAPPIPNTFVVNLGDMLERWSNGLFRSTRHRVLTAGDRERYSIPFFFEPTFDAVVECLESCCSPENPPKYPSTTSGQHLIGKYKQTHADFKPVES